MQTNDWVISRERVCTPMRLSEPVQEQEKKMPQTASTTQITREARYTGLSFPAFPFLEPLI